MVAEASPHPTEKTLASADDIDLRTTTNGRRYRCASLDDDLQRCTRAHIGHTRCIRRNGKCRAAPPVHADRSQTKIRERKAAPVPVPQDAALCEADVAWQEQSIPPIIHQVRVSHPHPTPPHSTDPTPSHPHFTPSHPTHPTPSHHIASEPSPPHPNTGLGVDQAAPKHPRRPCCSVGLRPSRLALPAVGPSRQCAAVAGARARAAPSLPQVRH